MNYRKLGSTIYIRMDRGDEVISTLLDICREEGISLATYRGIGGCAAVSIQAFDPALARSTPRRKQDVGAGLHDGECHY